MAANQGERCSILLTTYNRPRLLAQQLYYLARSGFVGPVGIFDSSEDAAAKQNKALATQFPSCRYTHLPSSTPVFVKFSHAVDTVTTPYCVLLPDDDFLLIERLGDLANSLDACPQAAAAHGLYFEFHTAGSSIHVTDLLQAGGDLRQETGSDRVLALMPKYQALTYAVCRTEPAKIAFAEALKQRSVLAQELLAGAAIAAMGPVLRLEFFSHGRRAGSSLGYRQWHPLEWSAVDPESLFREYITYREALLRIVLANEPELKPDVAARKIDLAHLAYLSQYLDADVLADAAVRRVDVVGADAIAEAAWDVWGGKRGAAWLRPLRRGSAASRLLRRMARKFQVRYRLRSMSGRGGLEIPCNTQKVRISPKWMREVDRLGKSTSIREQLPELACALAIREQPPEERIWTPRENQ
jgi:glycosyltransferase domain-containing protein